MNNWIYHLLDATTSIRVMGLTILEPVTVLTNLLITAVCLYAFFKMKNQATVGKAPKLFRLFFIAMALATAIGGIVGHGFMYAIGKYGKIPGWFISMAAIAFFERAAIEHARPLLKPRFANFFSIFNYIEIAIFAILTFVTLQFRFVEFHATYGLFVMVFLLELYVYKKIKDPGSIYIFMGTGMALLAAITHTFKLGFSKWFNHNDTSHILMAVGMYFYYLGGTNFSFYKPKRTGFRRMLSKTQKAGNNS